MNCFISGLNDELKSHVILNRPTTFDEGESLARLKDAVSKSTRCVKTESHGPTKLINQIHDLLNEKKFVEKQAETASSNDHQQERQRIAELEGQVQLLMSTINRPKQSTLALISTSCRTRNTAIHDLDTMKKEIIAAVRDEIRKDTQQNVTSDRQGTGTRFTGNNRYPRRESRGRNLRTTDGQPICNSCRKVGHVARHCKESGMANYLSVPTQGQYIPPPQVPFHNYQFPQNHHPTLRIMLGI